MRLTTRTTATTTSNATMTPSNISFSNTTTGYSQWNKIDTHIHTQQYAHIRWAHLVPFSSFKKCLRELLSRHLTLNAWMLLVLQCESNVYIVFWMSWTESSTIMWFSFESHHENTWAIIVHASVLFDSIQLQYLAHVVHFSLIVNVCVCVCEFFFRQSIFCYHCCCCCFYFILFFVLVEKAVELILIHFRNWTEQHLFHSSH